jgi:hypothetical protein
MTPRHRTPARMTPRHRTPRGRRPPKLALATAVTVALVSGTTVALAQSVTTQASGCTGSQTSVACTLSKPGPKPSTSAVTATPTPSASPTSSPTSSPTTTLDPTPDPTLAPTPTLSPTSSPLPTPLPTTSPTPTPAPSPTPSLTPSQTPLPPGPCLGYTAGAYLCSQPGAIDSAKTTAMRDFLTARGRNFPSLNGVSGNSWGMAYAVGTASDPVFHLTGSVPSKVAPQLVDIGFHAPQNFADRLTGTSDSPFVVVDEAQGITVMATKASKVDATTINVGAAGYFTHGTNGLDDRRPESNCKSLGKVCEVSRGRIPESMLVTAAEFAVARANHTGLGHVLEMFWPETDSAAGFKLPMVGAEGSKYGWGSEGQRVALDPSLNIVDRPGCTDSADVIVRTLQQNGAYIGDNAGGTSWVIKLEQNSAADPVASAEFSSLSQTELSGCVTAADFVATSDGPFN